MEQLHPLGALRREPNLTFSKPDPPATQGHPASTTRYDGKIINGLGLNGELRYHRQPVGALQALDPDRVLYAGTTSKPLAPALHVGHALVRLASYRAERKRGRYRRDAA